MSEGSDNVSFKDIEQDIIKEKERPSTLVRNLEKDNPGIINQGWIDLFIKDDHLSKARKNNYFKSKAGRTFTAKRSISLNRSF